MKISFQKIQDYLSSATRKDVKILAPETYPGEVPHDDDWDPTEVMVTDFCRLAYFKNGTKQTRHKHPTEIEIYTVLQGTMKIEVEGKVFELNEKETIVVQPNEYHLVIDEGEYIAQTIACGVNKKEL